MHLEWSNNVGFRSQRSVLAHLRMKILPLHIETGRYYRKPLQECVCLSCSDHIIKDEYHFLCCCTANSERDQLYRMLKTVHPDFGSWILNEKGIAIVSFDTNHLAKFVEKIWNIRKKHSFKLNMVIFVFFSF